MKNFGIWIRYDSRSGTHNMYKEFRELTRANAVKSLYQDMAARHRARFRSIHVRSTLFLDWDWPVKALMILPYRFFALWRLKRRRISVGHTSNSSLSPIFASRFLTVLARPVLPSSHIGRLRSKQWFMAGGKRMSSVCCSEHVASIVVMCMHMHSAPILSVNAIQRVHMVCTSDVREVGCMLASP